jgi:hypothetical protein
MEEAITVDVTYKRAITWIRDDFETQEEWEEFKKRMLEDKEYVKKNTLDNIEIIEDQLEMELSRKGEFIARLVKEATPHNTPK